MLDKLTNWLGDTGIALLNRLLPFFLILFGGLIVIKIVMSLLNVTLGKSKLEKAAHSLIRSLVKVVLYVLLGLIAASSLGIDVTGVVALASVVSLALSLSLQNLLANVIGGFTLLYTHPFHSGDFVEIDGQIGTVNEIGIAYTKLATPDNKYVSFPNNTVVSAQIINYTASGTRRCELNIYASYNAPIEKVKSALLEAAQVPYALEDPAPFVCIVGYGEKTIQYSMRIWCKTEVYWDAWFLMNSRIKEIMEREGLEVAYPALKVDVNR